MKILVVDDEALLVKGIRFNLQNEGYEVITGSDGLEAVQAVQTQHPDLVVLDVMMPNMDGLSACAKIREFSDVPIIMLTAKDDVSDKVMGLDMGADDYMTKPFAIEELLARIRVALKKHRADTAQSTGARNAGKLHMEPASYSAGYGGEPINLTKKEFDLLNYLWQHENTAITRDDLLTNVWGYEFTGDTNIVDVYIRYLRQKIDDRFGIKTIHTIRAVGYMFRYEQE